MFDIGGGELLLILIVVLVAFGPKKLPELAQSLGRGIREFKRAQRDFAEQINTAIEVEHRKQTRTVSRDDAPRNISRPRQEALAEPKTPLEPAAAPDQMPLDFAQEPRISAPVGERASRGEMPAPQPRGEEPSANGQEASGAR